MSLTKKHFERIANEFKIVRDEVVNDTYPQKFVYIAVISTIDALIINFADMLEKENPLFNRKKFLSACGFEKEEVELW